MVAGLRTSLGPLRCVIGDAIRGAFGRCVSLRRCTVHSLSLVKYVCEAQYWEGHNVRLKREYFNNR